MLSLFICLLLSFYLILPLHSFVRQCSSCTFQDIWCPNNEDCTINCFGDGCANSTIYCPLTRNKCNIQCISNTGQRSCQYLHINAFRGGNGRTTELTVNATGHNDILQYGKVLCPPQYSQCNIHCGDPHASCRHLVINASSSIYSNISLIATGSSANINGEIYGAAFGVMDIHCNGYQGCYKKSN